MTGRDIYLTGRDVYFEKGHNLVTNHLEDEILIVCTNPKRTKKYYLLKNVSFKIHLFFKFIYYRSKMSPRWLKP